MFDDNACDPDPCVYGNCTDLVLDYRCDCFPGYDSRDCSSEGMDPNYCNTVKDRSIVSRGSSGRVGEGNETWNLCGRHRWPSFFWLIFTGSGIIVKGTFVLRLLKNEYFSRSKMHRLERDYFYLRLGKVQCWGLICQSHGYCLYDDKAVPCECTDILQIPTCVESHHGKWNTGSLYLSLSTQDKLNGIVWA